METEMSSDNAYFCTDNQSVSLHLSGPDSSAVAPAAPKTSRLAQATLVFMVATIIISLIALFVMVLQNPRPKPGAYASSQEFPGDNTTGQLPVGPDNPYHSGRVSELQEVIQMFEDHVENSSTCCAGIQMLTFRVDNASSQIQMLRSHLKNACADTQKIEGILKDVHALSSQTQMLRSSLEGASAEIQKQKSNLEKASALNSQTQTFLKSSLENSSLELRLLSGGLENANTDIQALKAGLEMANTQAQVANSSLKNATAQILVLRGTLDSVNDLKAQSQALRNSLKGANAEIQRFKEESENCKTLTPKIQEVKRSLEILNATFASQEQLQKTQNQLLQLILHGWKVYSSNLYYFSNDKKSWHEAEEFCVSRGAHLASVTSAEEQTYLTEFSKNTYHWIGLTDSGNEGSWRWVDGAPFSYSQSRSFWYNNQPDNWQHEDGQTEDCVHIQQKWNDMNCNTPYQWICKKPISQEWPEASQEREVTTTASSGTFPP